MFKSLALWLLVNPLLLASCVTRVRFDNPPLRVAAAKQSGAISVVIDASTRAQQVSVRSATVGLANKWVLESGQMLVQMCDTEFPNLFDSYSLHESSPTSPAGGTLLYLTLPLYDFSDFRAKLMLGARAIDAEGVELFSKTYSGIGETQGQKLAAGAFAMRSAVRQSSHGAFVQAFEALMQDLAKPRP